MTDLIILDADRAAFQATNLVDAKGIPGVLVLNNELQPVTLAGIDMTGVSRLLVLNRGTFPITLAEASAEVLAHQQFLSGAVIPAKGQVEIVNLNPGILPLSNVTDESVDGIAASGTWTVAEVPVDGETLGINGHNLSLLYGDTADDTESEMHFPESVNTNNDRAAFAPFLADYLNGNANAAIAEATYRATGETVVGTGKTKGINGNRFAMADSDGAPAITVSGPTFTGGTDGLSQRSVGIGFKEITADTDITVADVGNGIKHVAADDNARSLSVLDFDVDTNAFRVGHVVVIDNEINTLSVGADNSATFLLASDGTANQYFDIAAGGQATLMYAGNNVWKVSGSQITGTPV